MTTIYAKTTDQILSAAVSPTLASGNQNTVQLHVDFDSAWDRYTGRSAVFFTSNNPAPYEKVISTAGNCTLPPEVLKDDAHLFIVVKGVNSATAEVKATTRLRLKVHPGNPSVVISDPTNDVYLQLLRVFGKNAADLSVLLARVNNLASLEEGSTTGDAELTDARTGADSVTYASLGEAIRGQMGILNAVNIGRAEQMKKILSGAYSCDLLNGVTWEENVGLNSANGKKLTSDATGYKCIGDMIPILPNTKYAVPEGAIVCEYDTFGNFLLGYSDASPLFTTSANTAYILYAQRPNNITPYLRYADIKAINKRLSVLGDSYSTYGGFMTPDTNRSFYNGENTENDVTDVSQTWWYKLMEERGYLLEVNNSYSGSPICNTGYDGSDASSFSFLARMENLGRPDVIAVFGGTNDSWAGVPVGEYQYANWTDEDLKSFRPAFAYMCNYLMKHNPNAEIYIIVNSGLTDDVSNSMSVIGEYYSMPVIVLPTFDKSYSGHPGKAGQTSIYEAVKDVIV